MLVKPVTVRFDLFIVTNMEPHVREANYRRVLLYSLDLN